MNRSLLQPLFLLAVVCLLDACLETQNRPTVSPATDHKPALKTQSAEATDRSEERSAMVEGQIERRGVRDAKVLAAMRRVKRDRFVPQLLRASAYEDRPLPIGHRQTISQPYVVAFMTEALRLDHEMTVLEIGTGSGYQAAVLAEIVTDVYSIEIVPALAARAKRTLLSLGYKNVRVRTADGYKGWPEAGPFDRIVLTASPPRIPQPLLDQLRLGGILVAPEGRFAQTLVRITRTNAGYQRERLLAVRFVPMTGQAQQNP